MFQSVPSAWPSAGEQVDQMSALTVARSRYATSLPTLGHALTGPSWKGYGSAYASNRLSRLTQEGKTEPFFALQACPRKLPVTSPVSI